MPKNPYSIATSFLSPSLAKEPVRANLMQLVHSPNTEETKRLKQLNFLEASHRYCGTPFSDAETKEREALTARKEQLDKIGFLHEDEFVESTVKFYNLNRAEIKEIASILEGGGDKRSKYWYNALAARPLSPDPLSISDAEDVDTASVSSSTDSGSSCSGSY